MFTTTTMYPYQYWILVLGSFVSCLHHMHGIWLAVPNIYIMYTLILYMILVHDINLRCQYTTYIDKTYVPTCATEMCHQYVTIMTTGFLVLCNMCNILYLNVFKIFTWGIISSEHCEGRIIYASQNMQHLQRAHIWWITFSTSKIVHVLS